jgi:hypothetical protein
MSVVLGKGGSPLLRDLTPHYYGFHIYVPAAEDKRQSMMARYFILGFQGAAEKDVRGAGRSCVRDVSVL